ncbi:hypothetical protein Ac2012v2_000894 [Leucoagaricus gongylophorus]
MSRLESILNPENAHSTPESHLRSALLCPRMVLQPSTSRRTPLEMSTSHIQTARIPLIASVIQMLAPNTPSPRLSDAQFLEAQINDFPYKQSIRHHLSIDDDFKRIPRPVTERGPGYYWCVDPDALPGIKRPRKRRCTKAEDTGPKKRGRPCRSSPSPDPKSSFRDENEGNVKMTQNKADDPVESEADSIKRVNSCQLTSPVNTHFAPVTQSYAFSPSSSMDKSSGALIERMQMEIGTLRQQSAEAVSVSLKLSEQLAQAQADASRLRLQLRDLQTWVEKERCWRSEIEKDLDYELAKRKDTEEALRNAHSSLYPRHPS